MEWTPAEIEAFNARFTMEVRQEVIRDVEELRHPNPPEEANTPAVRLFPLPGLTVTTNTKRNISIYDMTDSETGARYYFVEAFSRQSARLSEIEAEAEAENITFVYDTDALTAALTEAKALLDDN